MRCMRSGPVYVREVTGMFMHQRLNEVEMLWTLIIGMALGTPEPTNEGRGVLR